MRGDFSNCMIPGRFDFERADLRGAKFINTEMYMANMSFCILDESIFRGSCLYGCDFYKASMLGTMFEGANIYNSNFIRTDLSGSSYFSHSTLDFCDFWSSTLIACNFEHARLVGCSFYNSTLGDANFHDSINENTCIEKCSVSNAKDLPETSLACPEIGSFIGFKLAVKYDDDLCKYYIVTLKIPEDARRTSAVGSIKCRCDKAEVMAIEQIDGKEDEEPVTEVCSLRDLRFKYRLCETVTEPNYDGNRSVECSRGIHFFMSKLDAINYR